MKTEIKGSAVTEKCSRAKRCTLPDGHDGRHWSADGGFYTLLSERAPGFEYRRACNELACDHCNGHGRELWSTAHCGTCNGSGLKGRPRGTDR